MNFLPFIQSYTIAEKASTVSEQLRSVSGSDSRSSTLTFGVAVVVLVAACVIARRVLERMRWQRAVSAGDDGLELDVRDYTSWWNVLSDETRRHPERLLESPAYFSQHLSDLVRRGHISLARRLHLAWMRTPNGAKSRDTQAILVADHVVVRDDHGALLAEGFIRHVGPSDVEFVVYDEGAGWPPEDADHRAFIEKANGYRLRTQLSERRGDQFWSLIVGIEAEIGHRRDHHRVSAKNGALLFASQRRLAEVRNWVLHDGPAEHFLIREQRKLNPPTYSSEFERRSIWSDGCPILLEDIGAGGARVRTAELPEASRPGKPYYVFLSFLLDQKPFEMLLPATALTEWEICPDDKAWRRIRLQFDDLTPKEHGHLRMLLTRLSNVENATTGSIVCDLDDQKSPVTL